MMRWIFYTKLQRTGKKISTWNRTITEIMLVRAIRETKAVLSFPQCWEITPPYISSLRQREAMTKHSSLITCDRQKSSEMLL
jgi:hypothetical protein